MMLSNSIQTQDKTEPHLHRKNTGKADAAEAFRTAQWESLSGVSAICKTQTYYKPQSDQDNLNGKHHGCK